MMNREAPADMIEKVKNLAIRIRDLCAIFYEKATPAQKETLFKMLDELEKAMIAYRHYEVPWDSKLIEAVETIQTSEDQSVSFKIRKKFDTDKSVMDLARNLYVFIATEEKCNEC